MCLSDRSVWSLEHLCKNVDVITVDGFESYVTEQYKDFYENYLKTGKYFLMTNFYSNPDVLISTNNAEVQQLVQGSITADQWAENIDAKMASAQ